MDTTTDRLYTTEEAAQRLGCGAPELLMMAEQIGVEPMLAQGGEALWLAEFVEDMQQWMKREWDEAALAI
jgi:hypothetical protein